MILTLTCHASICYIASLTERSMQPCLHKTSLTALNFTALLQILLCLVCCHCANGYFLFLLNNRLMHLMGEEKFTKQGVRKYYKEDTDLPKKNPQSTNAPKTNKNSQQTLPPKKLTTERGYSLPVFLMLNHTQNFFYIHWSTFSKILSQHCKSIKRHIMVT